MRSDQVLHYGGIGSARDSHFTLGEAPAIVEEAHRLGRRAAVHAQGTEGILTARAGADTIEHATYLTEEFISVAHQTGASIVPTVALREAFVATLEKGVQLPEWRERKQRRAIGTIGAGFKLACEARLPVAAGSDFTGAQYRQHGRNGRSQRSPWGCRQSWR